MDLRRAIYTRRATRQFTAAPVDESTLRELIDAAVQTPSAVNRQPWSFCVVRDKTVLAHISREAKEHMLRTSPAGVKGWIDPRQKAAKTIHHHGFGTFVVDGKTIKLKSNMR